MAVKIKRHCVKDMYIHEFYALHQVCMEGAIPGGTDFKYVRGRKLPSSKQPQTRLYERIQISNIQPLLTTVQHHIQSNNERGLSRLLVEDFILEEFPNEIRHDFEVDICTELKGHHYEYQVYKSRSNFEQLALTPNFLQEILKNTINPSIKNIFLNALKKLDLSKNEGIDFRGIDLQNLSLQHAHLGASIFEGVNTIHTDFTYADLKHCIGLQQEQLEQSKSYDRAEVPPHCSIYWNDDLKKKLQVYLGNLQNHARANFSSHDPKALKVDELIEKYDPLLKPGSPNPPMIEKQKMLDDFKDSKIVFSTHRNFNFLFGEVLAFLGLLVIGYLAVGYHYYKKNGHFGIFSQPASEAQADAFIQCIQQHDYGLSNLG